MDYTNCPECSRPTTSTTWEAFDGETDGACWCAYCGWNDRNSQSSRLSVLSRTAAGLGITVAKLQAQLKTERWAADEAFLDTQEARTVASQKEVA